MAEVGATSRSSSGAGRSLCCPDRRSVGLDGHVLVGSRKLDWQAASKSNTRTFKLKKRLPLEVTAGCASGTSEEGREAAGLGLKDGRRAHDERKGGAGEADEGVRYFGQKWTRVVQGRQRQQGPTHGAVTKFGLLAGNGVRRLCSCSESPDGWGR